MYKKCQQMRQRGIIGYESEGRVVSNGKRRRCAGTTYQDNFVLIGIFMHIEGLGLRHCRIRLSLQPPRASWPGRGRVAFCRAFLRSPEVVARRGEQLCDILPL